MTDSIWKVLHYSTVVLFASLKRLRPDEGAYCVIVGQSGLACRVSHVTKPWQRRLEVFLQPRQLPRPNTVVSS